MVRKLTDLNVQRSIRRLSEERVRKIVPKIQKKLQKKLEDELALAFTDSLVAQEMDGGNLQGELGLTNPGAKKAAIEKALRDSVLVEVKQVRGGIRRFFPLLRLTSMRDDFKELLSLPEAYQTWTNAKGSEVKGPPLPWLQWLLLGGRQTIIRGANLIRGKFGRSGLDYTMSTNQPTGSWKVPPEMSGTATNNFLTRNVKARIPAIRVFFTAVINNAVRGLRSGR